MPLRDRGRDEATALASYWDSVVVGEPIEQSRLPDEIAATIRATHAVAAVPGPDPDLVARMWNQALSLANVAQSRQSTSRSGSARRRFDQLSTQTLSSAAAGAIAGVLVLGIGLRIAMRVAGAMTEAQSRGVETENGNRVGEITFGGSMVLIVLGALTGALLGIGYLVVRPWLPTSRWLRGATYGAFLFALGGTSIFESGRNPDYRQFGIAGVNVCLFGLLPLLFGFVVSPLADRFDRRNVRVRLDLDPERDSHSILLRAVPLLLIGFFAFWGVVLAPPLALILVFILARVGIKYLIGRFESPADLIRRPLIAVPAYGLIVVPAAIGLVSTLLAIERILA